MIVDQIFRFDDVSLQVNGKQLLNALSFTVNKGEFLTVLGASGAGKSSLLRMFNALSSPSNGSIQFRGSPIESDIQSLRQNVGILFQNPVVFQGSIKENLMIAGRWNNSISHLLDHELRSILNQVGLEEFNLGKNAKDLSGGEQQRLALACTLLNHPQVLLLDEPTSNLDSKLARAIMDLVDKLRRELDLTIIVVSHDHLLMREYAQRVILLSNGEIVADGPFKVLDEQGAFKKVGLSGREVSHET
ncbi:MAG: ABC transporter ATP-binding protein [Candidatus Marinimicrobia bacterium]|nr:ABC transporter ATP-binding protein [Candidatus Neomarinimicrobiota bacterium]